MSNENDGTYCELCGTAFLAGESRYDYWWWNGGTGDKSHICQAEKSHICTRCYTVVKRHIDCQTEPPDAPVTEDAINVACFADDMPSPEKWEAAQKHIAMLNEEELVRQAGNVLEAIHLEHVVSYYGMSDYKVHLRLEELLAELHLRIAVKLVAKRFTPMLKRQNQEIELYEEHDYDGLLREGFIDQEDYDLLQRVNENPKYRQAIDPQTEPPAPDLAADELTDDMVSPDLIAAEKRVAELIRGGCMDAGESQTDAPADGEKSTGRES